LRIPTEDAIIFQTFFTLDRTLLSEKSLITSVLLATAQKKQCQNATFQNRPPKGHVPFGATTIAIRRLIAVSGASLIDGSQVYISSQQMIIIGFLVVHLSHFIV